MFEIGVKLAHVLWRKLMPEQREQADSNLMAIGYDLLSDEKYNLAKAVLDFATDVLKHHSSEDMRLRLVVKRIQAYKWSGENERALTLLAKEDFSALGDHFKLAGAALSSNLEQAIRMVRRIGPNGNVRLEAYREWPLFKELRQQPAFHEAIMEAFNQPLEEIRVIGSESSEAPSEAESPG